MEEIGLKGIMDITDFNSGMSKYKSSVDEASGNTERKAGIMSKALGGIGVAAKGMAAVVGIGMTSLMGAFGLLTSQAIPAASDLNEAINASTVVFGEGAAALQEFARTAAQTTGLSAAQVNQLGAQMGAMLTNFGYDQKSAAQETIGLTQRAADMASIFNTEVSVALTAVQAGLRGETEPLRRFGVDVSDASIKAYALATGMIKAGDEMTMNQKVMARTALIYEQTNKIAGDFVNTSDQLANATRVQKAEWQNFLATSGQSLLPIVLQVRRAFMGIAQQALPVVIEMIGILARDALPTIIQMGSILSTLITTFILPAIKGLVSFITSKLSPILGKVGDALEKVSDVIHSFVNRIKTGHSPLQALTIAFRELFGEDVAEKFKKIADKVMTFVASARDFLVPIFEKVSTFVTTRVIPAIGNLVTWFQTNLPIALAAVSTFWTNTLQPALASVVEWLSVNIPAAVTTITDIWNNTLMPAFTTFFDWVSANWEPLLTGIAAAILVVVIPAIVAWVAATWAHVTAQLALAAATAAAYLPIIAIMAAVGTAVFLLYKAWDTNFMGIRTTLTDFWNNSLKPAFQDIWNWLSDTLPKVITAFKEDVWPWITEAFGNAKEFIETKLMPTLGKIVAWLGTVIKGALTIFKEEVWPWITEAFGKAKDFIVEDLMPKFKEIVDWLEKTIKNAINTFEGIWEGLRLAFKKVSDFIYDNITGPEGVFPKIKSLLETGWDSVVTKVETVWGRIKSAVQPVVDIFNAIKGAIEYILSHIGNAISGASNYANSIADAVFTRLEEIKSGHGGRPGAPGGPRRPTPPTNDQDAQQFANLVAGGIATSFSDIFEGLLGGALSLGDTMSIGSAFGTFASGLMSRYQKTTITPLEYAIGDIQGYIDNLKSILETTTDYWDRRRLLSKLQKAEEVQLDLINEYNTAKQKEIRLQQQLEDLNFLKLQADFLSFLTESGLDISNILGDLELGLDVDLAALIDAMLLALDTVVDAGAALIPTSQAPARASTMASVMGQSMMSAGTTTISKVVNISMPVTLSSGFDIEWLKNFIVTTVGEAIA